MGPIRKFVEDSLDAAAVEGKVSHAKLVAKMREELMDRFRDILPPELMELVDDAMPRALGAALTGALRKPYRNREGRPVQHNFGFVPTEWTKPGEYSESVHVSKATAGTLDDHSNYTGMLIERDQAKKRKEDDFRSAMRAAGYKRDDPLEPILEDLCEPLSLIHI